MNNMNTLTNVIAQLERVFDTANDRFYGGQLQKPVITVHPDNTKGAYGWCTSWKAWTDKEDDKADEGFYEINICAEYLNRPISQVIGTMLHEMVHLKNLQDGVQDTSRAGTYHNKKFKEVAEAHGLTVEKVPTYGYARTDLNDEGKAFVDSLTDDTQFGIRRKKIPGRAKGKGGSKQSSRKYVCPDCGCIIRATKEVYVICGLCNVAFEEQ